MGGKAQEADRVRMEHHLLGVAADVAQSLEDALRVAPYDERLKAWSDLAGAAIRARQALTQYMAEYGLLEEVKE